MDSDCKKHTRRYRDERIRTDKDDVLEENISDDYDNHVILLIKKKADRDAEKAAAKDKSRIVRHTTTTSTPGTVYIDLSHRTQLKQLTRRAVNAFRDMLISEKTQSRKMTAKESLALIERLVQNQIELALVASRDRNGNRRFPDITPTNWKVIDLIELCNKLLQTFDEVSLH